jgi:hypothetical protein
MGIGTTTAHPFNLKTGAVTRATIDTSGRLGIGTTSPGSALDVVGNARVSGAYSWSDYANTIYHGITAPAADVIAFRGGGSERARIDSSGRLLVGTSTSRSNFFNGTTAPPQIQLESLGSNTQSFLSQVRNSSADADGAVHILAKTRGTALNSYTIVQSGDNVGQLSFQGADGAEFVEAALIKAEIDGTPGANDMPGRLVFSTTADGASSPTERMRITSGGFAKFSNTGSYKHAVTASRYELRSNQNDVTLAITNSNASPSATSLGVNIYYDAASPNNTSNEFLYCEDSTALRASIRSNGGIANFSANNVNLSDINAKKDISLAAGTWDCLKEWEIVNFRYKDQPNDADLNMGVIAQQVAESCPEVITVFQEAKEATETDPAQEERLGVKDQQMMWMAIKALQEAQLRIETLEAANAELTARVSALEPG